MDAKLDREDLQIADEIVRIREMRFAQIRELVIEHRRFDVLASRVLGYDPQPHHMRMINFQNTHDEGLILAWRGAAKTTYCTITRAIGEILCDPNIRILIVSDSADQSRTFMREIKNHFMQNKALLEIFGDWYTGSLRWSDSEIIVTRRDRHWKEATVQAAGIDTSLPGRHYELILCDDLVTDGNSLTMGLRQKAFDYYYKTLLPTLAMPRGRIFVLGTRWHNEDLYSWISREDFADKTLTIPALDEETDESVWPEVFPTEKLHRIRKANLGAFELQYMCRSDRGDGQIFLQDHFQFYEELPRNCFYWQGVDPAVSQRDSAANFAHVTVAVDRDTKKIYLVDFVEAKLPFPKQVKLIVEKFELFPRTIRVVVEANAYQLAMSQQMRSEYAHIPVVPGWTTKDKVARANQLASLLGEGGIFIKRAHHKFMRSLCSIPRSGKWDAFDAFYIAVTQGLRGARKKREYEVGLL